MSTPLLASNRLVIAVILILLALVLLSTAVAAGQTASDHDDLLDLFHDWRAFQKAPLVDGVPDYSPSAMAEQHQNLRDYQARLAALDTTGWPIPDRVDYHLVWAEMNGLDFDHRVVRPWENNPAFYTMVFPSQSDVPEREGPQVDGTIELWAYQFPLAPDDASEIAAALNTIPELYGRAKSNLTGNGRDLWVASVATFTQQIDDLDDLSGRVNESDETLVAAISSAREATVSFRDWLAELAPTKTGPSGIGKDNYEWYLQNVHLVPYTWDEQVALLQRELDRALATLKLEEHRNRDLPPLEPVASEEEFASRYAEGVLEYIAFLRDNDVVTMRDYMEPAQRAQIGRFVPPDRERGFFTIVDYHDPIIMRTHSYHWIELARLANEPHSNPIRQGPLLYNIFDGRAEGLATGMEELLMHAGLLDDHPRSKELIWILLAQRGARALAAMHLHANEMTLEEAAQFASERVPRGWLPADGSTITHEVHFYLQQPVYGTSYVIGKIMLDNLMAERARQQGDDFTLKGFIDDLNRIGIIPVSMIRWELAVD